MKFLSSPVPVFRLVFICLSLCIAKNGHAADGVEKWSTELRFSKDGSVLITEEIVAMVAPGEVVRGAGHLLPQRAGVFYKKTPVLAYEALLGFIDSKSAVIGIETQQGVPRVTLRRADPLTAGVHVYLLQYKVAGAILKDAQAAAFAWPVVTTWKGGVRVYQIKIIPPEFVEPSSLIVRLLRKSDQKIISKEPLLALQDGGIQFSGDADQDGALVLGINFPIGFFN